jgi:hypothetical protein
MLIIDPKKENKVIQRLSDYNTAVFWLAEDEYMNQLWDSNPVHDDRDIISMSHARLAFAGRSSSRWF